MTKLQYRFLRNPRNRQFSALPLSEKQLFGLLGRGLSFEARINNHTRWVNVGRRSSITYQSMFEPTLWYRVSDKHRPEGYPAALDKANERTP